METNRSRVNPGSIVWVCEWERERCWVTASHVSSSVFCAPFLIAPSIPLVLCHRFLLFHSSYLSSFLLFLVISSDKVDVNMITLRLSGEELWNLRVWVRVSSQSKFTVGHSICAFGFHVVFGAGTAGAALAIFDIILSTLPPCGWVKYSQSLSSLMLLKNHWISFPHKIALKQSDEINMI